MPYSYMTWATLNGALAQRLGDPNRIFWPETSIYLTEALRTFGSLSAFWRERGTFATTQTVAFYDLPTLMPHLVGYTVTDWDLITEIQHHLLESAIAPSAWTGTEMFTLRDLTVAIQRRRDQFLSDTGIVLSRSLVPVASPPIGRQELADTIMDVRRAAWLGVSPFAYYTQLWREDERALTSYQTTWSVNPNTPEVYSVMAPPPLELQLAPPPVTNGQLELITVDSGAMLDPTVGATILGIPDDLAWIVKWGALADLLGKDGAARDPARAAFCEKRYTQGVQLARMMPFVVHAELNGVPLLPCTLGDLDAAVPNWQNSLGTPTDIAIEGANLVWVYPVPNDILSLTFDVVRRAPIPTNDGDLVQFGREQLDMVLDYAEHLAMFKVGGDEWAATMRQADNFLQQSIMYNRRLSAAARYVIPAKEQSQREKAVRPREMVTDGLGALPSTGADRG